MSSAGSVRSAARLLEMLREPTGTAAAFETTLGDPVMGKARTLATLSLGVGAAGAGAAIIAAFRSDMRAARARLAARSRLVETACGPVEVAESGSGPPILVVHGTGGGFDQALMAAKGPFGTGYRVIAPSRFGYLRSPMPADASHAAQADTLAALLDALQVPRATVMALSAGAGSVQGANPQRRPAGGRLYREPGLAAECSSTRCHCRHPKGNRRQ